jgi:hypothetical protein
MNADESTDRSPEALENRPVPSTASKSDQNAEFRLNRWLVYFASGTYWSSVGEFVATDATSAIERAVEVFGEASAYRAEMIPWDAIPLLKPNQWTPHEPKQ